MKDDVIKEIYEQASELQDNSYHYSIQPVMTSLAYSAGTVCTLQSMINATSSCQAAYFFTTALQHFAKWML